MRGTSYPIVALHPPAGGLFRGGTPYDVMRVGAYYTRRANKRLWEQEDMSTCPE